MAKETLTGPYAIAQEILIGGFMLVAGYQFFPQAVAKFLPLAGMGLGATMAAGAAIMLLGPPPAVRIVDQVFETAKIKGYNDQPPRLRRWEKTPSGYKLRYILPPGVTLSKIQDHQEALQQALDADVEMHYRNHHLHMELFNRQLPDRIYYTAQDIEGRLPIPIGWSREGLEVLDLAGSAYPHLLVGGLTGGGKSVFLRQALVTLATLKTPQELKLHLADLKGGVEFSMFAQLPHVRSFAKDINETVMTLDWLLREMEDRLKRMEREGAVLASDLELPYHLLAVDEFAELAINKKAEQLMATLARRGRAAGIHLILATQRPDAKVITGQVKANIDATVAFRVRDGLNSRILLDNNNAALLPPVRGRAIFQADREREVQVMYLSDSQARRMVRQIIKQYPADGTTDSAPDSSFED